MAALGSNGILAGETAAGPTQGQQAATSGVAVSGAGQGSVSLGGVSENSLECPPPDISEQELRELLEMLRGEITASKRHAMVIVLKEALVDRAYITDVPPVVLDRAPGQETDPVPTTDATFVAHVNAIWQRHDPGSVIMVVVTSPEPLPFIGLKLAPLPWIPAGRTWCPRCGARTGTSDGAKGGSHRC